MSKQLYEMTLEELWRLFPIVLVPHSAEWKGWYLSEACGLRNLLHGEILELNHIGSTAVPAIMAKPIVDILLEVRAVESFPEVKQLLESDGWICMRTDKSRVSFNKGYTSEGYADKVYHLHLRTKGDNAELYFRDYLQENVSVAKSYEKLKIELWHRYEHNRDAYTDAKSNFVNKYTERAKRAYRGRYQ